MEKNKFAEIASCTARKKFQFNEYECDSNKYLFIIIFFETIETEIFSIELLFLISEWAQNEEFYEQI